MRDFERDRIRRAQFGTGGGAQERALSIGLAVIGAGPFFARQTASLIEAEFNMGVALFESVEQASEQAGALAELQLLIVYQRQAEDLLARPEVYRAISPNAAVALAYNDAAVACQVYASSDPERHGRFGFLPMGSPFEVWLAALRLLLHREIFVPSELLLAHDDAPADATIPAEGSGGTARNDLAAPARHREGGHRLARLTEREKEVLHLASRGESNKHIALKLAITEHTVKLHMHNLSRKLGVANRTAAASFYMAEKQNGTTDNQ